MASCMGCSDHISYSMGVGFQIVRLVAFGDSNSDSEVFGDSTSDSEWLEWQ